jgi:hypothetical protein
MKETIEFRIPEEHAASWLRPQDGVLIGGFVRKYELDTGDPRIQVIRDADRALRARGRAFFTAWITHRRYSRFELEHAELFHLRVTSVFEPAGEECGTQYDETTACPKCGSGAQQVGPLFLDEKRIPRGKDISRTIAGEIVVSRRLVEVFQRHEITGVTFDPVRRSPASNAESDRWLQMVVTSSDAEVVAPTRVGENPFDEDDQDRGQCSLGDLLGLNLLSEVFIGKATRGTADVISSKRYVGVRRGLLRPQRLILVSPRVRRLIETEKLKGCAIEVAHLV